MLELRCEETPDALVVHLRFTRLDALAASEFRHAMSQRVPGYTKVILAMDEVIFMDSSGLGSLVSVLKYTQAGGSLRLAAVHPNILALLKMTKLAPVFPCFATVEAALNA